MALAMSNGQKTYFTYPREIFLYIFRFRFSHFFFLLSVSLIFLGLVVCAWRVHRMIRWTNCWTNRVRGVHRWMGCELRGLFGVVVAARAIKCIDRHRFECRNVRIYGRSISAQFSCPNDESHILVYELCTSTCEWYIADADADVRRLICASKNKRRKKKRTHSLSLPPHHQKPNQAKPYRTTTTMARETKIIIKKKNSKKCI